VLKQPPPELAGDPCGPVHRPGAWIAVDIERVAAERPATGGPDAFPDAVEAGAALLADRAWTWLVGVDIGTGYRPERTEPVGYVPSYPVLTPPYRDGGSDRPLALVQARCGVVPFVAREERQLLLDWCTAPDASPEASLGATRIAVVHGPGGSGKTHLAAELCRQLSQQTGGWYSGFLARHVGPQDLRWLAGLASPLAVVVDYAENWGDQELLPVFRELRSRTGDWPTCPC
jgi:hypothetical protein